MSTPARGAAEYWRTAAGFIIGLIIHFSLASSLAGVLLPLVEGKEGGAVYGILHLLLVGLMGVSAIIVTTALHKRHWSSLIGNPAKAGRDFVRVLTLQVMLIFPALLAVTLLAPFDVYSAAPLLSWLLVLPFGALAVLLQCTGEELVFRGYLQQQLAARTAIPAIWMGVPSAIFGAAHYSTVAFGDNALMIAIWSGLFGIAMADLTARTGTLGAAIAVHFAVNAWSLLAVALPGPMVGMTLFVWSFGPADEAAIANLMPVEFAALLVTWLAARLAIGR